MSTVAEETETQQTCRSNTQAVAGIAEILRVGRDDADLAAEIRMAEFHSRAGAFFACPFGPAQRVQTVADLLSADVVAGEVFLIGARLHQFNEADTDVFIADPVQKGVKLVIIDVA